MIRVSGVDQVVWVMTGVKGLTDVCWGMLEVDAGVDIVNEWLDWRPGFGYANAGGNGGYGHPLTRSLVIYYRHRRPILAD